MGAKGWGLALAGLLVTGCGGPPGPCGSAAVVDVYSDPGPWDGSGWSYVGDDGSGGYASSGDDGSGGGSDPSAGSSDPTGGTSDPSGGDTGGSSGDGSSGSTGDDSSGDDGSGCIRPGHFARRGHQLHASRPGGAPAASVRLQTMPAPVVAADANGCYACTMTCVIAAAPAGQPNAATAIGGSDISPQDACSQAVAELDGWATNQGAALQACRVGGGVLAAVQPSASATTSAPPPSQPVMQRPPRAPAPLVR